MLYESEEFYRNIIAQVKDYAIFATNPQGVITTWNEGCKNVLGYDRDEFIGQHIKMLFTPEGVASGAADKEMEIAAEKGSANDDRWLMRKSGERFWASGMTTGARNEVGDLTGFTKVLRDLTERKQYEERLRESQMFFRLLTESLPHLVWTCGGDGECDYLSPQWESYTGVPESEQLGFGWLNQLHPDDREPTIAAWNRTVKVGGVFDMEFRIRGADGNYRWFKMRALPLRSAEGAIIKWFGTNTDIEDRKRLEEGRERLHSRERDARAEAERMRAEAEAANDSKDEFLATVSHDLRSPLNAILGWARLLRDPKVREEQLERALEIVERNAQAQTRLTEDLLDVSRIVSGKLSMRMCPLTLNSTVKGVAADIRHTAEAKGIDLRMTEDEEIKLIGDADRLQQVVWNLLSNAIKFTPEGGRIEVELKRVGESAELRVSDTGRGISPEFLPLVFDRFRQFTGTDARGRAGLGLGLTIVRHIVEAHGGSVTAESLGVGLGATFTLKLPLGETGSETMPAVEPRHSFLEVSAAASLSGVRVLVVDDDEDACDVLRAALNNYGAEVRTAADAFQALDILASEKKDVLVSDINMPGMDGYEFLRRVRAMKPEQGGRIPAIALTAYAGAEDHMRALQAGYQMHVPKPIEPAELEVMVATLAKSFNKGN